MRQSPRVCLKTTRPYHSQLKPCTLSYLRVGFCQSESLTDLQQNSSVDLQVNNCIICYFYALQQRPVQPTQFKRQRTLCRTIDSVLRARKEGTKNARAEPRPPGLPKWISMKIILYQLLFFFLKKARSSWSFRLHETFASPMRHSPIRKDVSPPPVWLVTLPPAHTQAVHGGSEGRMRVAFGDL